MNQNTNDEPFSLINYEAEIQITDNIEQYKKAKQSAKKLDTNPSPQDILNNMIVPRDWKSPQNKYFMQYVSHSKCSRDDVFQLKQSLQQAIEYRQARKQGICPIRQQLFSQTFDQLIRQVSINCCQRGLLLMRVRDQHKMSLAAYQTLYQSSVQFGIKKQLQSQQGMQQLKNQLTQAQDQRNKLKKLKIELESKRQELIKRVQQRKEIQVVEHEEQNHIISQQANNLQAFLSVIRFQKQEKLRQTNHNNPINPSVVQIKKDQ